MPKVLVMREADAPASKPKESAMGVEKKLCKHKYSSYPYCYGEIADNPGNIYKFNVVSDFSDCVFQHIDCDFNDFLKYFITEGHLRNGPEGSPLCHPVPVNSEGNSDSVKPRSVFSKVELKYFYNTEVLVLSL